MTNAISWPIWTYFTRWLIRTNSYDLTRTVYSDHFYFIWSKLFVEERHSFKLKTDNFHQIWSYFYLTRWNKLKLLKIKPVKRIWTQPPRAEPASNPTIHLTRATHEGLCINKALTSSLFQHSLYPVRQVPYCWLFLIHPQSSYILSFSPSPCITPCTHTQLRVSKELLQSLHDTQTDTKNTFTCLSLLCLNRVHMFFSCWL